MNDPSVKRCHLDLVSLLDVHLQNVTKQKYAKICEICEVNKADFKGNGLLPDFLQQVRIISPFCQEMEKSSKMDRTRDACGGCCFNTLQTKVLLINSVMETPVPSPSFRKRRPSHMSFPCARRVHVSNMFKLSVQSMPALRGLKAEPTNAGAGVGKLMSIMWYAKVSEVLAKAVRTCWHLERYPSCLIRICWNQQVGNSWRDAGTCTTGIIPDWSSIWPNNSFARCARPKEETLWSLDLFLEVLYTLISWTCIDIYSSFSLYANFVRTTRNVQPNLLNQSIIYLPAESEKKTVMTVAEPNVSGAKPANNLSLMPTYCAYYLLAARLPKSRWLIWGYSSQRCSRNPSVGIWLSTWMAPPRSSTTPSSCGWAAVARYCAGPWNCLRMAARRKEFVGCWTLKNRLLGSTSNIPTQNQSKTYLLTARTKSEVSKVNFKRRAVRSMTLLI